MGWVGGDDEDIGTQLRQLVKVGEDGSRQQEVKVWPEAHSHHGCHGHLQLTWIARQQEVVVLPTPPLPPTNTHFSLDSMIFRSDASGNSWASADVSIDWGCSAKYGWKSQSKQA